MADQLMGPKPTAGAKVKQQTQIKVPTANDPQVKAAAAKRRQDDEKKRQGRSSTNLSQQPTYSRTRLG